MLCSNIKIHSYVNKTWNVLPWIKLLFSNIIEHALWSIPLNSSVFLEEILLSGIIYSIQKLDPQVQ